MANPTWGLEEGDRSALIDLIVEFAWRVDHRMAGSIHELVTDDIEMKLASGTFLGKDAVVSWGTNRDLLDRTTSHLAMNFRFQVVHADKVVAGSTAIIFRHDGSGTGAPVPWAVTEYDDVFVRVNDEWKFQSRISRDIFVSPPT